MNVGKAIRLSRMTNPESGKVFFATLDHGFQRGVLPGIENLKEIIKNVADGGPDVMTMHKGPAKLYFLPHAAKISLAIKSTTFSPYHPNLDVPVAEVEEVQRRAKGHPAKTSAGRCCAAPAGKTRPPRTLSCWGIRWAS